MRGKTIKCQYAFPIECFHLVVSLGFFKIPWMFHFEFFQIPQFQNSRKFKIPRRRNSKFQAVNAIFQTTSTSKNLVRTFTKSQVKIPNNKYRIFKIPTFQTTKFKIPSSSKFSANSKFQPTAFRVFYYPLKYSSIKHFNNI